MKLEIVVLYPFNHDRGQVGGGLDQNMRLLVPTVMSVSHHCCMQQHTRMEK